MKRGESASVAQNGPLNFLFRDDATVSCPGLAIVYDNRSKVNREQGIETIKDIEGIEDIEDRGWERRGMNLLDSCLYHSLSACI